MQNGQLYFPPLWLLQINAVSERIGNVPVGRWGTVVVLWFPYWYEESPVWRVEGWKAWQELLSRCHYLTVVAVMFTSTKEASFRRKQLETLYRRLNHPRIGIWLIVKDEWAEDIFARPFMLEHAMIVDRRGIIRYSDKMVPFIPNENQLKPIEEEYRKIL